MGRLKALTPRLLPIGSRLKPALTRAEAEAKRLKERDQAVAWRKLYKTARWERLRQDVFVRDGFVCQKTGVLVIGRHPAPNSAVAHHKIPHRGDERLFWDPDNIETVSKEWHDGPGQAEERAGFASW